MVMTIWFTSDEHYGHARIIEYCNRPFRDVDQMTEELIKRHNLLVKEEDLVIHVGDFTFKQALMPAILERLKGRHALVAGNHDGCHRCHNNYEKATHKYLDAGFVSVAQSTVVENFLVAHLPYVGDYSRYGQFRPKDEGLWLLHGHVHEAWKVRDRMVNVGVDQWSYAPVSLEELKTLVKETIHGRDENRANQV
jgi:calcineurin-like phosphoesterase family protein